MKENQQNVSNAELAIISERAKQRESKGGDPFSVFWQQYLESLLLLANKRIKNKVGQIVPSQIDNDDEWKTYCDLETQIDLPPSTCAVLVTPSAFKSLNNQNPLQQSNVKSAWESNSYNLVMSYNENRDRVIQTVLPASGSIGIDVYEDGNHFADFSYNTIEECVNDLTDKMWMFLAPKAQLNIEQIIQYTESWFFKNRYTFSLEKIPVHKEYNYLYNSQLINIPPIKAVFKLIESYLPIELVSLDSAVQVKNDFLSAFEKAQMISVENITNDVEYDCSEFLSHIVTEIDGLLDIIEFLDDYELPKRNFTDSEYNDLFYQTAQNVYTKMVGKKCPQFLIEQQKNHWS
jgi:hypothetical protein